MWDLPGPGIESASPALAGGFLTTAPPGKLPLDVFALAVCIGYLEAGSSKYVLHGGVSDGCMGCFASERMERRPVVPRAG